MKTILICLSILFSSVLLAQSNSVITDENGGSYLPYQDPELNTGDSIYESVPLIGERYEEIKENHCRTTVQRACIDYRITLERHCSEGNRRRSGNECPAACKAWAEDCDGVVSDREIVKQFDN